MQALIEGRAPVASVQVPRVRLALVRRRNAVRHPEALGQPVLLTAVPYEGPAEEAFAFNSRHRVTPSCDAVGDSFDRSRASTPNDQRIKE